MKQCLRLAVIASMLCAPAFAGIVNPDCTPEKAAKSAATKATVGVGGRCSPAEAAKDSAKKTVKPNEKTEKSVKSVVSK